MDSFLNRYSEMEIDFNFVVGWNPREINESEERHILKEKGLGIFQYSHRNFKFLL